MVYVFLLETMTSIPKSVCCMILDYVRFEHYFVKRRDNKLAYIYTVPFYLEFRCAQLEILPGKNNCVAHYLDDCKPCMEIISNTSRFVSTIFCDSCKLKRHLKWYDEITQTCTHCAYFDIYRTNYKKQGYYYESKSADRDLYYYKCIYKIILSTLLHMVPQDLLNIVLSFELFEKKQHRKKLY